MTTYQTLEAARNGVPVEVLFVLEIDHITEGRCFIGVKAPSSVIKGFVCDGKLPEIKAVIAQHSKFSEQQTNDFPTAKRGHVCNTRDPQRPCCWEARKRMFEEMAAREADPTWQAERKAEHEKRVRESLAWRGLD